jgi:hypothetical protein
VNLWTVIAINGEINFNSPKKREANLTCIHVFLSRHMRSLCRRQYQKERQREKHSYVHVSRGTYDDASQSSSTCCTKAPDIESEKGTQVFLSLFSTIVSLCFSFLHLHYIFECIFTCVCYWNIYEWMKVHAHADTSLSWISPQTSECIEHRERERLTYWWID